MTGDVITILVAIFCVACAVLLYAVAVGGKAADDADDDRTYGDWPAVRLCNCDLNFPICDSRCCPTNPIPPVAVSLTRGGGPAGVVPGGAVNREVAPFHTPRHTPGDQHDPA